MEVKIVLKLSTGKVIELTHEEYQEIFGEITENSILPHVERKGNEIHFDWAHPHPYSGMTFA